MLNAERETRRPSAAQRPHKQSSQESRAHSSTNLVSDQGRRNPSLLTIDKDRVPEPESIARAVPQIGVADATDAHNSDPSLATALSSGDSDTDVQSPCGWTELEGARGRRSGSATGRRSSSLCEGKQKHEQSVATTQPGGCKSYS
ncbi:hypothetical protein HBI56_214250 [Parastagonospora nodorum]|nr:hypothetical protein HBH56_230190 [Parastagonospora nodorum]KAH3924413.1 hypothetical protein HBH54_195000 [Parastagonospora nodorum]KAH3940098.1 hypothetical protein HBH53_222590 [Parastagonospora nodorum]KAH3958396.1 hypothetical protein HBH51_209910 [Parastagonospora nodorum]KAH3960299.1 hypothetical protein HBH52_237210 [Parastagonospora nodorum]